jgi:hypothetical protein
MGRYAVRRGISSQNMPSSSRPALFLRAPPHCLKKKGTSSATHRLRTSRTQSGSTERAPGPDSPPTITQSSPATCRSGSAVSRGSIETNLVAAGTSRSRSIRATRSLSSTVIVHGPEDPLDKRQLDFLMEQVTHRVHEDVSGTTPSTRDVEHVRMRTHGETVDIVPLPHRLESFRHAFGIAVGAAGGDLGAPRHGVPGRFCPLY